jgi:hypothetical protein
LKKCKGVFTSPDIGILLLGVGVYNNELDNANYDLIIQRGDNFISRNTTFKVYKFYLVKGIMYWTSSGRASSDKC